MLCGADPDFPLSAWDHATPQAELTLNLMRASNTNPLMSSWEQMQGPFNIEATPIAAFGTKVVVHDKPLERATWVQSYSIIAATKSSCRRQVAHVPPTPWRGIPVPFYSLNTHRSPLHCHRRLHQFPQQSRRRRRTPFTTNPPRHCGTDSLLAMHAIFLSSAFRRRLLLFSFTSANAPPGRIFSPLSLR